MMGARTSAPAAREQLDALVPPDHLLRRIARALDLTAVRDQLGACYRRIGRPSGDPEGLLRLLLVGYRYGVTSERRLVVEARVNVAYRWFAGLPLGAPVPHHSTFSKNRHGRFRGSGVFRGLGHGCGGRLGPEDAVLPVPRGRIRVRRLRTRGAVHARPPSAADGELARHGALGGRGPRRLARLRRRELGAQAGRTQVERGSRRASRS